MPDIENTVVRAADLSIIVTADTAPAIEEMNALEDDLKDRARKKYTVPVTAVLDTAELDRQLGEIKKDDTRHVAITADLVRGAEYADTTQQIEDEKAALRAPVEIVVGIKPPDPAALDAATAEVTTRVATLKALIEDLPAITPKVNLTQISDDDQKRLASISGSLRTFARAGGDAEEIKKTVDLTLAGSAADTKVSTNIDNIARSIKRLNAAPKSVTRAVTLNSKGFDNADVIANIAKAAPALARYAKIDPAALRKDAVLTNKGFGAATVAKIDSAAKSLVKISAVPDKLDKAITLDTTGLNPDTLGLVNDLATAVGRLARATSKPLLINPVVQPGAVAAATAELDPLAKMLNEMVIAAKYLGHISPKALVPGGSGGGHGSSSSNAHATAGASAGPVHGYLPVSGNAVTNVALADFIVSVFTGYEAAQFQHSTDVAVPLHTAMTAAQSAEMQRFAKQEMRNGLTDLNDFYGAYNATSGISMSTASHEYLMDQAVKASIMSQNSANPLTVTQEASGYANLYSEFTSFIAPKGASQAQIDKNMQRYFGAITNASQVSELPLGQFLSNLTSGGTIPANLGTDPAATLAAIAVLSKHGFAGNKPGTYTRDVYSHLLDQTKQSQQVLTTVDRLAGSHLADIATNQTLSTKGLPYVLKGIHDTINDRKFQEAIAQTAGAALSRGSTGQGPEGYYIPSGTFNKKTGRYSGSTEILSKSDIESLEKGGQQATAVAFKFITAMRGGTALQALLGTGYPDFLTDLNMIQRTEQGKSTKVGTQSFGPSPIDTAWAQSFNDSYMTYKRMMGNLKVLSIDLGQDLLPFFNLFAKTIIPQLQNLDKWAKANPDAVKDIALFGSVMALYKPAKALATLPLDLGKLVGKVLGLGAKVATMTVTAGVVNVLGAASAPLPSPGGGVVGGGGIAARAFPLLLKATTVATAGYLAYTGAFHNMDPHALSSIPLPLPKGMTPAQAAQANANLRAQENTNPLHDFVDWVRHLGGSSPNPKQLHTSALGAYQQYRATGGKLNLQGWGEEMSRGILGGADATTYGQQHFKQWEIGFKQAAGIKSPSTVMMEHGKALAQGLLLGFRGHMAGAGGAASAVGSLLGVTDNAALADVSHTTSLGRVSSSYAQLSSVFQSNQMSAGVTIAKIAFDSFGETLTQLREQVSYFTTILLPGITKQLSYLQQAAKLPGATDALKRLAAALAHVTAAAKDLVKHWPKNLTLDETTTKHITTVLKTKGTTPGTGPGAIGSQDVTLTAGYNFSGLDGAAADLTRRRAALQKILKPLCLYGDFDFSAYLLAQISLALRMKAMQQLVHLPLLVGRYDFAAFDRANQDIIYWMKTIASHIHPLVIPVHYGKAGTPPGGGTGPGIDVGGKGVRLTVNVSPIIRLTEKPVITVTDKPVINIADKPNIHVDAGNMKFPGSMNVNVTDFLSHRQTPIPVTIVGGLPPAKGGGARLGVDLGPLTFSAPIADWEAAIKTGLKSAWSLATKGLTLVGSLGADVGSALKGAISGAWDKLTAGGLWLGGMFMRGFSAGMGKLGNAKDWVLAGLGKTLSDDKNAVGAFLYNVFSGGVQWMQDHFGSTKLEAGGKGIVPNVNIHLPQGKDIVAAIQGALNWASIHAGGYAAGAASLGASILKGMLGDATMVGNTIVNDVGQGIMYVATRTGAFGVEAANLGTALLNALGSTIYNGYNALAPNFTHLFQTVLAELGNKGNALGTQMLSSLNNLGTMIGHAIFDPAVAYFKSLLNNLWKLFFDSLSKIPGVGHFAPHPPPPFKSTGYTGSGVGTMMTDYAPRTAARPYANPDNAPGSGTSQVTPLVSSGADRQPIQIILDGKVIAEHVFNVNQKNQYLRSSLVSASSGVMA